MKVVHFFIHVFSVLVYLTIGSLLLIMSLRIASMENVISAVRQVYQGFWNPVQTFILGILFICVGLAFARFLVKRMRQDDALVYQSQMGRITISLTAIEDVVRKAVKKFLVVKDCKVKTELADARLDIILRLILWSSHNIPDIIREVQDEVRHKLIRILSLEYPFDVKVEVLKVEEHEAGDESSEDPVKVSSS
ncbi:MAG TPA: alkaline shock response membrane anchor protein AmaP [Candidatus Omnitrophota bacterium]|nr:alkaline shock response membrane anchor protein AmaP [Candidatus Omnitrophota bacterium]